MTMLACWISRQWKVAILLCNITSKFAFVQHPKYRHKTKIRLNLQYATINPLLQVYILCNEAQRVNGLVHERNGAA